MQNLKTCWIKYKPRKLSQESQENMRKDPNAIFKTSWTKMQGQKETKPPVKQKKDHFANKENLWTETQSQKKPQTQEHKRGPLCNKNKT